MTGNSEVLTGPASAYAGTVSCFWCHAEDKRHDFDFYIPAGYWTPLGYACKNHAMYATVVCEVKPLPEMPAGLAAMQGATLDG